MPRCYHSVVALGSKLVVFGGNDDVQSFSDLAYLECTPTVSAPDTWSWHWPVALGRGPRARTGASATAIGDRYIVVTGGWDPHVQVRAAAVAAKAAKGAAGGGRGSKRNSGGEVVSGEGAAAVAAAAAAAAALAAPAPGMQAAHALAVAASSGLRTMKVEGEAEEGVEEPFPEAWVLDTQSWEWLRVAGEVEAPAAAAAAAAAEGAPSAQAIEALKCAAGRAGHACVLLHDARPLLSYAASSAVACPGAAEALAEGASASSAPLPALLMHGGLKADGTRHGDCALLTLPPALCGLISAPSAAAAAVLAPASQEDDIPLGQVDA